MTSRHVTPHAVPGFMLVARRSDLGTIFGSNAGMNAGSAGAPASNSEYY